MIFTFFSKIRTREPRPVLGNLDLNRSLVGDPYSGTWTRTWEPGPVLGNLYLNRSLVWDPYSGTWTRTREPVLVYVLKSWLNIDETYSTYLVVVIVVIGFEHT